LCSVFRSARVPLKQEVKGAIICPPCLGFVLSHGSVLLVLDFAEKSFLDFFLRFFELFERASYVEFFRPFGFRRFAALRGE